jgi:integrase
MRPRKNDRDLPSCVYRKHGAFWHVKGGKWTRLGDELPAALASYAKLLAKPTERVPGLLYRWLDDVTVAKTTLKTYQVIVKQLCSILDEFEPHQVTARDITALMHHHRKKPGMANHMRTVLIGALEMAYMEKLVERNVARDTRPLKVASRDRYITDSEFDAIYSKATPTLRVIMDLCYYTGQRIGDVLAIRYADISDNGVAFKQKKTGNQLTVEWTTGMRAAVDAARALHQNVKGLTLLHTRQGKPFSYSTIRTLWDRALLASGIKDVHMHDIRAKSGTDASKQGLDSKKLLGHKSESSHARYLRDKEIPVATSPKFRKHHTG